MRTGTVLAALAAAASTAHAHATFQYLWVNGVDQGNKYVRPPANNSPITDLSSKTLACNNNGEVAAAATLTVAAGAKVAVEMHQQPGDRSCATEAIGGNHDGPTIIYMAKVDNAATAVGSDANWFKVAQTGLVSKDYWGTDVMNANCGKVEFTIPSDIPAGNYLIRAEVVALHVASSVGGAQLYMSCYQINVTGGGSASPATVKFPGAYSPTDPGILFDLYGGYTSYTIPGPAVYTAGGSSGGGGSPVTTTRPATTTAATSAAPTTTATGPLIPKYGQCGGQGWTGGTTCVAGSTCSKLNDYYSQCT
ncbi:glycoside hydrolase family 61 protein [Rhizoctonia solani]|uniref:AA9 family lytic polysaccharide monooxygenase n=1 Tax=Rhizoctonia solani TaxID=456999 RepID=A0A8H7HFB3_9AGAM|nr:glycoside hydrolase family 61 protein [Rhizoctonia solani]KAF8670357.1 Glycoside Hydrolase Family 61 [Rhizoctonia solani]KAF8685640.1 Glycoside Hydrolase Family 61 [Rhizoctonia solani]QRW20354.1 glycoside hydrolase family 61 protein [Rhizoctonia solani]